MELAEKDRSKIRRSSFKSRRSIQHIDELGYDTVFNDEGIKSNSVNHSQIDLKKKYIEILNKEYQDWERVLLDKQMEYKQLMRTNKAHFFDESLLTKEEREFLNGKDIYNKLTENLSKLDDAFVINLKLKAIQSEIKTKKNALLVKGLSELKRDIYNSCYLSDDEY